MPDIVQVSDLNAPLLRAITLEGVTLDRALFKEFGRAAAEVRTAWHDDIRHDMAQLLRDVNENAKPRYLQELWLREMTLYGLSTQAAIDMRQQLSKEIREYVKNHPHHIFASVGAGSARPPYDIVIKHETSGVLRFQEIQIISGSSNRPVNDGIGRIGRRDLNETGIFEDEFLAEAKARGLDEASANAELAQRFEANLFEDSLMFKNLKQHWDFTAKGNHSNFAQAEDVIREKYHFNLTVSLEGRFAAMGYETGASFRRAIAGLMIRSFPHAENPNPAIIARARGLAV